MIDFYIVIVLKVLLFVSLSFLAVAVEFGTRRLFGFGFRLVSFDFVQGSEIIFQIIHKQKFAPRQLQHTQVCIAESLA